MKDLLKFSFVALIAFVGEVKAQCTVEISPDPIVINCGDYIDLTANGISGTPALSTSFDGAALGAGWSSSGNVLYTNPCGPSLDGTPAAWFGNVAFPRLLTTNGFDMSCGGQVCFDLDFAGDENNTDCEDPDLIDEGVFFQYSINGGASWIDIYYFEPTANISGPFYTWANYCFTIPAAAWTTNTMFQWSQPNASSAGNDHWGLDNVVITPIDCGYYYDWANLPGSPDAVTQTVNPQVNTTYTVTYTDGTFACVDSVEVVVQELVIDATSTNTNIVCADCPDLDMQLVNNNAGSIIDDFDPTMDLTMWGDVQSGTVGGGCSSMSGNALYFDGTGADRYATSAAVNTTNCGMMSFSLFMGNTGTTSPCGNSSAGEDIVFEYSTNAGVTWTTIATYLQSQWDGNNNWQSFAVFLPPPAQTLSTTFRWRQVAFTACVGCDNWSLDNVSFVCAPPPYDYQWTPATGLSDPLIQNPQACPFVTTNYVATITDPVSGCTATDSVLINVSCNCTFMTFTGDISDCENGNTFTVSGDIVYIENPGTGTLIVEATNASGTYTQTINGPFVDGQLYNYSISGITSDGSPVSVTAYFSDELTCTTTLNDDSPVLPEVTSISGGGFYCFGDPIDDILVDVTGNGPWTLDYTLDGVAQTYTANDTILNLGSTPGVYEIVQISDAGCVNTAVGIDSIVTQALPTVEGISGGSTYCFGDLVDDIFVSVTGTGPWDLDYTLDGVANTINSATTPISLGNAEGVYTVTGITDQACSNTASGSSTILINALPNVGAGVDYIVCDGDATVLNGTGAQTYVWDNAVTNGVAFTPVATNTYQVVGTDVNGCSNTDDITVFVEPLPTVSFVADSIQGCEPFQVVFVNTTPGNMQDCLWNFGGAASFSSCDTAVHLFEGGGLYDVTLTTTSVNGCTNSITYDDYIYVEDNPSASFTASSTSLLSLNTEVTFTNSTIGAVDYVWDFDDDTENSSATNPTHTFPDTESAGYVVTLYAYSPIGCVDSTNQVISIKQEIIFYIPNTFTPDGDEFNQTFQPVFTAGFDASDFELYIRNRWGELVFESNDVNAGWDGTYNGKLVQEGTYIWHLEFKDELNDARYLHTGHITIIR